MKNYQFLIDEEKYIVEFTNSDDSLIIKIINDNNKNNIYEKEYNFDEIYEMNKKYKEVGNKNELFDLIYYDFFESKKREIKFDGNYIIINNKEINKEIKLEKIEFNEDDIFNDIFNKLSSLENQVNQFTQNGQNLRINLENNLEKIEHIIKNTKK